MCVKNFSPKINQALVQVENIVAHVKLKSSEYFVEKAEKSGSPAFPSFPMMFSNFPHRIGASLYRITNRYTREEFVP